MSFWGQSRLWWEYTCSGAGALCGRVAFLKKTNLTEVWLLPVRSGSDYNLFTTAFRSRTDTVVRASVWPRRPALWTMKTSEPSPHQLPQTKIGTNKQLPHWIKFSLISLITDIFLWYVEMSSWSIQMRTLVPGLLP